MILRKIRSEQLDKETLKRNGPAEIVTAKRAEFKQEYADNRLEWAKMYESFTPED